MKNGIGVALGLVGTLAAIGLSRRGSSARAGVRPILRDTVITDAASAKAFIWRLAREGLDFHFEDDPSEIIVYSTGEPLFSEAELPIVNRLVDACFEHLDGDPFPALIDAHNAVHGQG